MTNNELTFRFLSSDRLGQLVRLPASKCSIGSGENCTLRLAGHGLRPVHCFIVGGPGGTVVRRWSPDTRLNGQPFRDAALRTGDRLSLGPVELEFVDESLITRSEEVDGELQAHEQELDALRIQLHEVQLKLEAQSSDHAHQLANWSEERQAFDELLAQAERRERHENQRFTQHIESFARLQAEWHTERDELVARCEHLQHEFDAAISRAEAANLTRRAVTEMWSPDDCVPTIADKQAELAAAEEELAAAQTELEAAKAEFIRQSTNRQNELDRLEGELRLRQNELTHEAVRLQRLRETLDAERVTLQESHRHTHDRLEERLAATAVREAELAEKLNACQTQENELHQARLDLQREKAELTRQCDALRSEVAALQARLEQQQLELQQASDALRERQQEFDAEQQEWQDERHTLAIQLDEQESQRTVLQQELAQLRAELELRLAEDAQPLECEEDDCLMESPLLAQHPEPQAGGASEAMQALARLRAEALNESDDVDDESQSPAPFAEQPLEIAGAGSEKPDDTDVSIEDYMAQLMQRVRGKSEDEPQTRKRRPVAPQSIASSPTNEFPAAKTPSAEIRTKPEPAVAPQETLRNLPPRAAAPEVSHSLQAMRELANQSARSAIDTSAQRRWRVNVRTKFALSIAAGVGGAALLTFGNGLFSWTTAAAAGSFVVAGLFAAIGVRMRRQGLPLGAESQR